MTTVKNLNINTDLNEKEVNVLRALRRQKKKGTEVPFSLFIYFPFLLLYNTEPSSDRSQDEHIHGLKISHHVNRMTDLREML